MRVKNHTTAIENALHLDAGSCKHEETMAKFKNDIAEIDRLLQAEQTEGDAQ